MEHSFSSFVHEHIIEPFLSFVFPELCTICNTPLKDNESYLCTSCSHQLTVLDKAYIRALKEEIKTPFFDELIIIYQFDPVFQTLIHLLKYQRFKGISVLFAKALQTKIKGTYDYISAVPLNSVRLRERGYNQSALIAEHLAQETSALFIPRLLERIKNTPSQTKLNREQRIKNMQDAFISRKDLTGQTVLLVDDVITTGSTLNACARVLKSAGAKQVDISALATPVGIFQKNMERAGINSLEFRDKNT